MEIKKKPIQIGKKGEEVGVKIPEVKKGDDVYVVHGNLF